MPSISHDKIVTPPFDKAAVKGFASNMNLDLLSVSYFDINHDLRKLIPIVFLVLCLVLTTSLNIGTQHFIGQKILPKISGKLIIYYQYWSSIASATYFLSYFFTWQHYTVWIIVGPSVVINILVWIVIACISGSQIRPSDKSLYINSNSSPAAIIPSHCCHFFLLFMAMS